MQLLGKRKRFNQTRRGLARLIVGAIAPAFAKRNAPSEQPLLKPTEHIA